MLITLLDAKIPHFALSREYCIRDALLALVTGGRLRANRLPEKPVLVEALFRPKTPQDYRSKSLKDSSTLGDYSLLMTVAASKHVSEIRTIQQSDVSPSARDHCGDGYHR